MYGIDVLEVSNFDGEVDKLHETHRVDVGAKRLVPR
jgi:hypothetical protein